MMLFRALIAPYLEAFLSLIRFYEHLLLSSKMLSGRRQWHPTPVFLPGKSHGWRSLVGCSPWGCKESDMTEWLPFHFSLSCIGEGNGNPLQCSCLENPRDGGAWWAAVYGVTQSRTQLKQLSSSLVKTTNIPFLLKTVIAMKQIWSDVQEYTGCNLTVINGFVGPVYGPGFHQDG